MDTTEYDTIREELTRLLGFLPPVPDAVREGFQCLYLSRGDVQLSWPVTVTAMGVIWSVQGLLPKLKDPRHSVFDDCPLLWFAGYSTSVRSDLVYYLDCRPGAPALYFRGETVFMGEERHRETAGQFAQAIKQVEMMRKKNIPGEVIYNRGEAIVRILWDGKLINQNPAGSD